MIERKIKIIIANWEELTDSDATATAAAAVAAATPAAGTEALYAASNNDNPGVGIVLLNRSWEGNKR